MEAMISSLKALKEILERIKVQVHFKTLSSKGRKELLEYIQEFQEFEEILKKICTKVKDAQVRKQEKEKKEIAKLLIASDLKEFRETLERRAALSPEEREFQSLLNTRHCSSF